MIKTPVITVDGPSGSGKGTVAESLAAHYSFHLLDSGALYRLLGLAVTKNALSLEDLGSVTQLASTMNIAFGEYTPGVVSLDGEDVTLAIRTDKASAMASRVGAIPQLRDALFDRQLAFRQAPGLVADGRDMGSVVFPDAVVKIYLTASLEQRAKRRHKQLIGKGIGAMLPALLQELRERDVRDSQRSVSPLKPADDAHIVDTSAMTLEQTLKKVLEIARLGLPF